MATMMVQEWRLLEQLSVLSITALEDRSVVSCAYMRVQPELIELLKTQQLKDEKLAQILTNIEKYSPLEYTLRSDGILLFRGRICIPSDEKLKQEILKETHKSHYTIHPGVAKCTTT